MKTSSSAKHGSASSNSKTKKNSKEREKRKTQQSSTVDSSSNQVANHPEKGSPTKETSNRKYAGYGPEQFNNILEQCGIEHITEEASAVFTEDVNYKLRHLIFDAVVEARLLGRNHINASDVNSVFESLQIEKVYGAPANPHWIPLADQNIYYLDDNQQNLIEISEEFPITFSQPGEAVLTRKWLPEKKEVSKSLRLYFVKMCQAVVAENNPDLSRLAIKDIGENTRIGPIVEWFYNFSYKLLSTDITYGSLTLRAIELVTALESNPVAICTVPEKQIQLLTMMLLQRLLRPLTSPDAVKPISRLLALLCRRVPLRRRALIKHVIKFGEMKAEYALPILCAVNELGIDAVLAVFLPNLEFLLSLVDHQKRSELTYEILRCYNILIRGRHDHPSLDNAFYETFGDTIVPMWRHHCSISSALPSSSTVAETNWPVIRTRLLRSRHGVTPQVGKGRPKIDVKEAFFSEENGNTDERRWRRWHGERRPLFKFRFYSIEQTVRSRFTKTAEALLADHQNDLQTQVIIGKRSLLCSVFQKDLHPKREKCVDHSLIFYNL